MYYKTAYDTTLGKLTSNIHELNLSIEKYLIIDYPFLKQARLSPELELDGKTIKPIYLTGLGTTEEDIPSFAHSFLCRDEWLVTDLRTYITADKDSGTFAVRNEYEFGLNLQRAILSGKWVIGDTTSLYNFKFPHDCFATWLSEVLTKRFGLSPNDQLRLQALTYIYYYGLFQKEIMTDSDIDKLMIRVKTMQFMTVELMSDVYKNISLRMDNIGDFCREAYNVTGNVRLKGMTIAVLMTIIATNWFGHNAKELVATCLEHPPTWISLVYASLNLRSFKNTYISNIVNKVDKRQAGDNFMKDYNALTKGSTLAVS